MSKFPVRRSPLRPAVKQPRIGLALGGGGARGIAHILTLEVFDELGIRPSIITGTSIGAIYGAAYASGLSAAYIRAHTEEVLSQRLDLVRQLVSARAQPVQKLFNLFPLRTAGLLSAEAVLDRLLPPRLPATFAGLPIPLAIVATDFHAQEALLVREGVLKTAVAASMALPALFEPVSLGGRSLIDGGLVNPLPFDLITPAEADLIIAIDVSGGARDEEGASPGALEALFASTQILQRSIVREKLKSIRPDIYIDSTVERFHMLEFHKFRDILKSALPAKGMLKRQLERVLAAETIAEAPALPEPPQAGQPAIKKKRRLLLPVRRKPRP